MIRRFLHKIDSLLFASPYSSFQAQAKKKRDGTFKCSYHEHLKQKRKARLVTAGSVFLVLISVVTVNIAMTVLNYDRIEPVYAGVTLTVDDLGDASDASAGNGVCATAGAVCTLRAAIEESNALGGANTIDFSVSGTIETTSVLTITNSETTIDGGVDHDVIINGLGTGGHICLYINNSANNIIKGLVVQNCSWGVYIYNTLATGNKIQNNYIGTNAAGDAAVANDYGVYINTATNNFIGTDGDGLGDSGEGNVISGNVTYGVRVVNASSTNNMIAGNYIGTNVTGDGVVANGSGVQFTNSSQNSILGTNNDGTSDILERNVISGNTTVGVSIVTSYNNIVTGNYIGLNAAGTSAIANGVGLTIFNAAASNTIGNGNIISGNTSAGMTIFGAGTDSNVISGNYIGLNALGTSAVTNGGPGISIYSAAENNRIGTNGDGSEDVLERNVISGNIGAGIAIGGAGTNGQTIAGNYIGLNAAGDAAIPNTTYGIDIKNQAQNTRVGTDNDDSAERNVISGNTQYGIYISDASTINTIVAGNYIGTAADGVTEIDNDIFGIRIDDTATTSTIDSNIIAFNGDGAGEYGVSIEDSGTDYHTLTENSMFDNFSGAIQQTGGANDGLVAPAISGAVDGGASATITLSGTCPVDAGGVTIELFESDGSGQGETYIGNTSSTDGSWSKNITGSYTQVGKKIVATATDSTNNTSVFSTEYTIPDIAAVASTVGSDVTVNEEAAANLVGTASYDPNSGDTVTYLWERIAGETAVINNSTLSTANFTAPLVGADSSMTVRLTVGGGDTDSVVVAIVNLNSPPSLDLSIPDQSLTEDVSEDAKFDLDNYFSDVEGVMTWSAVNDLDVALGTMDVNVDGTIDFNLVSNANGSDTVVFRATDTALEYTDSNTVIVTVSPANDAPILSLSVPNQSTNEDTDLTGAFDLDSYFSDIDSGDSCVYSVVNDLTSSLGIMTLQGDGTVDFDVATNANGNDVISFRCTDSGLATTDTNDITFTINPVNDAPVVDAGADQAITEDDEGVTLNGAGSLDIDGDTLTYAWTEVNDTSDGCDLSSFTGVSPEVELTNKETGYSCQYKLIVNDGIVSSGEDTVTLNVDADNDPPDLITIEDKTVAANNVLIFAIGANDVDTDTVSLSAVDVNNDFSTKEEEISELFIDNQDNTGTFYWQPNLAQTGTYIASFKANDGVNNITQLVNITVTDGVTINDISRIQGRKKGAGTVTLYDQNDEKLCVIEAWAKGGAIGRSMKFQSNYYIGVIKYRSGKSLALYDLHCQLVKKQKLSTKKHVRRMVVDNLIGGSKSMELAVSSKIGRRVLIKIYRYNVSKEKWSVLKKKQFNSVPTGYTLKVNKNKNILIKKGSKVLHKWKI